MDRDIEDTRQAPEYDDIDTCIICGDDFPVDTCAEINGKYICDCCIEDIAELTK